MIRKYKLKYKFFIDAAKNITKTKVEFYRTKTFGNINFNKVIKQDGVLFAVLDKLNQRTLQYTENVNTWKKYEKKEGVNDV